MSTNYTMSSNNHRSQMLSPSAETLGFHKNIKDITDVVWIQTGFIGDIVLTTSAIAALHHEAPHIAQHVITTKIGVAALKNHPLIKTLVPFAKREGFVLPLLKVRSFIRKLGLKNPVTLQPHLSMRSSLLANCIGFPVYTFREAVASWFAFSRTHRVALLHESNRNKLLLESLGLDRRAINDVMPRLPETSPSTVSESLTNDLKWVGIVPGSVWGTKRWPAAKFASVAQMLLDFHGIGIVLLGSPDEHQIANFIEDACLKSRPSARGKLINLAGKTSLEDLNSIYPRLALVVSNDSSSVHYASAYQIPTLEIFGATVPNMGFGPLAVHSAIAEIPLACRPCSDHGPKTCPLTHFKCMNDLSTDLVMEKIKSILQAH